MIFRLIPVVGVMIWRVIVGNGVEGLAIILGVVVALVGTWITNRRWKKKRKASPGVLVSSYTTFLPNETSLVDKSRDRGLLRGQTPVIGWTSLDRRYLTWEPRWGARRRGYQTLKVPIDDIADASVTTDDDPDTGHIKARLWLKLRDGRSGPLLLSSADEPEVRDALRSLGITVH
jgi:hypothetical protein